MSFAGDPLADPEFVARYSEGPKRFVPGHQDMVPMCAMCIAAA
jgi:hypothetical protein